MFTCQVSVKLEGLEGWALEGLVLDGSSLPLDLKERAFLLSEDVFCDKEKKFRENGTRHENLVDDFKISQTRQFRQSISILFKDGHKI